MSQKLDQKSCADNGCSSWKLPASFWIWFGDSVVVDDNGDPLRVYHGGKKWDVARDGALWFTEDYVVSDGYSDQWHPNENELKCCYIRIERPLDMRDEQVMEYVFDHVPNDEQIRYNREYVQIAIDYAKAYGYDGVIHPDSDVRNRGDHLSYVVFSPKQVKAAEFGGWEKESVYTNMATHKNNGNYDRDKDSINEAKQPVADFTLSRSHGFYDLAPQTPKAKAFVANLNQKENAIVNGNVILDSFFANAGDWCRLNVLPKGFSVLWGDVLYTGKKGEKELWDFCM